MWCGALHCKCIVCGVVCGNGVFDCTCVGIAAVAVLGMKYGLSQLGAPVLAIATAAGPRCAAREAAPTWGASACIRRALTCLALCFTLVACR